MRARVRHVEPVGPLRGDPHHTGLGPADPDRQRPLFWLGRADRFIDAVVLAVVRRAFVSPETRADLERLDQLRHAHAGLREVVAVGAVLDLLPPGADADLELADGDAVD